MRTGPARPGRPRCERVTPGWALLGGDGQRDGGCGGDGDLHPALGPVLELHVALDQGEDGVVLAEPDVAARLHLGAALADDDVAGQHVFAAELLHAEAASGGVAPVAGRAARLLVCHGWVSWLRGGGGGGDARDPQHGDALAVAVAAAAVLAAALLEDDHRRQPVLGHHRGGHGRTRNRGRADGQAALAATDREHVGEGDGAAGFGLELLDFQHALGGDPVLLTAGADDCEHGGRDPERAALISRPGMGGRATRDRPERGV